MKKPKGELGKYSDLEIDFSLYSFIGIEFEHICLQYIKDIFQSCEISVRRRYYYIENLEENYIVPDVLLLNLPVEMSKKINLTHCQNLILDFKRSIYSIGPKDIQYLQIIPNSNLIFCLFQEQGKKSWRKIIHEMIKKMKIVEQQRKNIVSRIIIWTSKSDYIGYLDKNNKKTFLRQLQELEELGSIKKIENINQNLITSFKIRNDSIIDNLLKELIKNIDSLQVMKYLVLLKEILAMTYFTKEDLMNRSSYSQPIIEAVLNFFLEKNIIGKKVFYEFSVHFFYYISNEEPGLITFFNTINQNDSAKGLEILVQQNKIPKFVVKNSNFNDFRNYFGIDDNKSISLMFKIVSLFENLKVITPQEISSSLHVNQNNSAELLRILVSKGFLFSYKLEWEPIIRCYSLIKFKKLYLSDISKYLPKLILLSIIQIKNTTEININFISDLKAYFGSNWYAILQIFGILVKYKDLYPNGYNPDDLVYLIRSERLNYSFTKTRKMLAPLSRKNLNLLAIERENLGSVGKIKHYFLQNQNSSEFSKNQSNNDLKSRQVQNALKIIKPKVSLTELDIRSALKDGWTIKLRIYYVLKSNMEIQNEEITVSKALSILIKEGIFLSKTNFLRYFTPFGRSPFNLVTITRTKRGEYAPIKTIKIL